jgi:hypothetical protein
MDEQTLARLSSQISEAMMEQMMKGRMPEGMSMGGAAQLPELRVEPAGSERVKQYSYDKYEIYRGQKRPGKFAWFPSTNSQPSAK